jgi:hypothetical protein
MAHGERLDLWIEWDPVVRVRKHRPVQLQRGTSWKAPYSIDTMGHVGTDIYVTISMMLADMGNVKADVIGRQNVSMAQVNFETTK